MINQKVVLVTGASSGIGQATARLLTEQGFCVFGTSRNPACVHGEPFTVLPLDVRSEKSVKQCVDMVLAQTGRIDVLMNNAGYFGPVGAIEEVDLDDVQDVFQTNFFGMVRMVNAVLPTMRQQKGGQIINMGSIAGIASPPFYAYYTATKRAIEGYTESLRYEVKHFNVRVSCVEPGYFSTNLYNTKVPATRTISDYVLQRQHAADAMDLYIEEGGDASDVARTILKLINSPSPRLQNPVGFDAAVIALFKNGLPDVVFEFMGRVLFDLDGNFPLRPPLIATLATQVRLGLKLVRPWLKTLGRLTLLVAGLLALRGKLQIRNKK